MGRLPMPKMRSRMVYKINPYLWQKIDDDTYFFQTQNSTIVITNIGIVDFLIKVESAKISTIDDETLKNSFGVNYLDVGSFLLDNGLIFAEKEKKFYVKRIVLITDDRFFMKMVKNYFSDIYEIDSVDIENMEDFRFEETDLLLAFSKSFSIELIERLKKCSEKNDSYLKVIFPYDSKLYFTNIYKKSWCTPCPLCFVYELESQSRGEAGEYSITFQTIMDLIYLKKADFEYEIIVNKVDYLRIGYILSKYIKVTPTERDINEVIELDLATGKINTDTSYHWGYCDCYE